MVTHHQGIARRQAHLVAFYHLYKINIDDKRTVNPREQYLRQMLLDLFHGQVGEVFPFDGMDLDIVHRAFDVNDLIELDLHQPALDLTFDRKEIFTERWYRPDG